MDRISIFQRLPYPLRVAAASARGLSLNRTRYGRETEALVQAALAREHWPIDRWHDHQQAALRRVLAEAAMTPWYRRHACSAREPLSDWPVLPRSELRRDPTSLLSANHERRLVDDHTSGTTGTPLLLHFERGAVRHRYALHVARLLRWNGADRDTRWAIIGGQLVAAPDRTRPPFWVWNAAARQLYLSAFHISETNAAAYARALSDHRVEWMLGYPSAIAALVGACVSAGVQLPPLRFVVSNAEPLFDHQREAIEQAFTCVVREEYGMSEAAAAASECEAGSLHLWPEVGIVEVLSDDGPEPVAPGEIGRLVCTGLLNRAMPLVRYEVGDRGALAIDPCPCGRTLPVLSRVEGRVDDVLVTSDGRTIGRLDGVFKSDLPIVEAQIAQLAPDHFEIRVVPAAEYPMEVDERLRQELRRRVGPVHVDVVHTTQLSRTANGKLRAVVCEFGQR